MTDLWLKFRSLAVVCFAILLCQAMVAFLISQHMTEAMVQRDATVIQQLLQQDASIKQSVNGEAAAPTFSELGQHIVNLPGIVRANLYSPDQFIRYSSDKNLIGIKFENNLELKEALAGHMLVSVERISADSKSEHMALGGLSGAQAELIEAYIPLLDATGKTFAVVEYYKQASDISSAAAPTVFYVWLISMVAGFAIIALVVGLKLHKN